MKEKPALRRETSGRDTTYGNMRKTGRELMAGRGKITTSKSKEKGGK